MDSIEDMKQGHANRISRDAAVMLENMGNLIAQVINVTPSPVGLLQCRTDAFGVPPLWRPPAFFFLSKKKAGVHHFLRARQKHGHSRRIAVTHRSICNCKALPHQRRSNGLLEQPPDGLYH